MKDLKKSNKRSIPHSNNHRRSDSIINNKDSVIWTIQAVIVHLEEKIDLHKVGMTIIN
jgi:hypothetical protein